MQQWRLKNKIKDVLEECATSFTHSNEDISGNVLASRDTKGCDENNPSFPDPISTPTPPALCSCRLICMASRKGLFGSIFNLDLTKGEYW